MENTMIRAQENSSPVDFVHSTRGRKKIDAEGSPISGSRMDASQAYAGIPELLQNVINNNDASAWTEIVRKIDYIYTNIDNALLILDKETGFIEKVKADVGSGKKLFFKPNLVGPVVIHPVTHGEDVGAPVCTDWTVIAALMRWFHDTADIHYHQMLLGEASTASSIYQNIYSKNAGMNITTEAIFEGRSGDFYGGWAFYFVRIYLSTKHPLSHTDDPMRGYKESVDGIYIPPGKAGDRLMVYDLNKLFDDPSRGRTVPVPEGANFLEITLHKVIIGGDPRDPEDMKDYPGSVLVNVPKLKLHAQDLITNATKNLGIGLYPTHCPIIDQDGESGWKYALPPGEMPSFKGKLPHMPWIVEVNDETNLPLQNADGTYIATKTAGMPGTQADVIRAVQAQNIFIMHVTDAIDIINLNHNPEGIAVRIPEGFIWSSLDCVALDLLCARYCFKTIPMAEGIPLKERNGWITEFVHHVPVAKRDGKNIITSEGLDSPLFRYNLFQYTEKRGVGQQKYFVSGWDSVSETILASLDGHLGKVDKTEFIELMTGTMYYNPTCMLWDMQETLLSYAKAHDELMGSSIYNEFMDGFDENQDGIIDYDENGRKGFWTPGFSILSYGLHLQLTDENFGSLKGNFYQSVNFSLKHSNKAWNADGHDFAYEYMLMWIATCAYDLSKSETINSDPFVPGMNWGKGMWPSWQYSQWKVITNQIYGSESPETISYQSLYGAVFQYADKKGNNGSYTGSTSQHASEPGSIQKYFGACSQGADLLDFTLYVPIGYGNLNNVKILNVEETEDPRMIFTAQFNQEKEIW